MLGRVTLGLPVLGRVLGPAGADFFYSGRVISHGPVCLSSGSDPGQIDISRSLFIFSEREVTLDVKLPLLQ